MKKRAVLCILFLLLFGLCAGSAFFFLHLGQEREQESAPKINSIHDVEIYAGEPIPDFSEGVKVSGDIMEVAIDSSAVHNVRPGEYPVIYRYKDQKGMLYEESIICKVLPRKTITKPGEEKREDEESVIQEPVKTGEEWKVILYGILCTTSFAVSLGAWLWKRKSDYYLI